MANAGFSRKGENHAAAVVLNQLNDNFIGFTLAVKLGALIEGD